MTNYIDATQVISPKAHWHLFDVILDRKEGSGAYALGTWDGERRVGFRWNGNAVSGPIGNPQSRGLPTWTILDPALHEAVVALLAPEKQALARRFLGLRSDAEWRSLRLDARQMHQDRTTKVAQGNSYVPVLDGALLVMHVIPFSAIDARTPGSSDEIFRKPEKFPPIGATRPSDSKIGYDGLLTGSHGDGLRTAQRAYVHVTRAGIVEAVAKVPAYGKGHEHIILPQLQGLIVKYAKLYAAALNACGVSPPMTVAVSLVHAKGMRLLQDFLDGAFPEDLPFGALSEDQMSFSDAMFETVPADYNECARLLSPLLNHVSNAAGMAAAPYFDADGNYLLASRLDLSSTALNAGVAALR